MWCLTGKWDIVIIETGFLGINPRVVTYSFMVDKWIICRGTILIQVFAILTKYNNISNKYSVWDIFPDDWLMQTNASIMDVLATMDTA